MPIFSYHFGGSLNCPLPFKKEDPMPEEENQERPVLILDTEFDRQAFMEELEQKQDLFLKLEEVMRENRRVTREVMRKEFTG
jgi:hypothetical protein